MSIELLWWDIQLGPLFCFICRKPRTKDAETISRNLRAILGQLHKKRPYVFMLDTEIPSTRAYTEATTRQIPVHRYEPTSRNVSGSAAAVMNTLTDEILTKLNHYQTQLPR